MVSSSSQGAAEPSSATASEGRRRQSVSAKARRLPAEEAELEDIKRYESVR